MVHDAYQLSIFFGRGIILQELQYGGGDVTAPNPGRGRSARSGELRLKCGAAGRLVSKPSRRARGLRGCDFGE